MVIEMKTREAVLASHALLQHLRPEDLHRLAAMARVVTCAPHATIFQKGDPGDSMMAVVQGKVKICAYSRSGKELVLNILGQGEIFGEIAMLDGRPRTADAVALEQAKLLVLERNQILPMLTANAEVMIRMIEVLCRRIRHASETLEDSVLREAPSRLARGLLRLAGTFGTAEPGGTRLNIKLSQHQIGSLVGASRESVNKHLSEWQRAGLVILDAGNIVIHEAELLKQISEIDI